MKSAKILVLVLAFIVSLSFAVSVSINSTNVSVNNPDSTFVIVKVSDNSTVVHSIRFEGDFVKLPTKTATFIGNFQFKAYFNGKYGKGIFFVIVDGKQYPVSISFSNPWVEDSLVVSLIKGQVLVQKKGKKSMRPLFIGARVKEGDLVLSLESGYVKFKIKSTNEIVELGPLSQMYIESLKYHKGDPRYKNVVINVYKGKERNDLFKGLKEGSKFEIKGPSATAGVRGTKFTVVVDDNGDTEVQVERGKVAVTAVGATNPVMVVAGQQIMVQASGMIGKIQKLTKPESLQPQEKEKKPTTSSTPTKEKEENKPKEKSKMGVDTSTTQSGTETYYMLTLNPNLHNIFGTGIGVGLDITVGIDKNQHLVYGTVASTNILSAFNIRWLEYKNKNVLLHYGEIEPITYDYGLLMTNYYKKGLKGVEIGLSNFIVKGYSLFTYLPWDIESIYPFKYNPTSTLYSGKIAFDLGIPVVPMNLELSGVYESESKLKKDGYPYAGISTAISMPISPFFTPYAEYATLFASETGFKNFEKYGVSAGFIGGNNILSYQFSMLKFTDQFIQNYFGNNYETLKNNVLTGAATSGVFALQKLSDVTTATSGWVFGANLNLFILKINGTYYAMNGQPLAPILSVGASFNLPIKNLPLEASAQYTKYKLEPSKFFEEINKNAILEAKLIYPTPAGLAIEVDYTGYFDENGVLNGQYSLNTSMGW